MQGPPGPPGPAGSGFAWDASALRQWLSSQTQKGPAESPSRMLRDDADASLIFDPTISIQEKVRNVIIQTKKVCF